MVRKVLLFGNPNVGKSVIFARLTGTYVITANYPGTTVGFTKGDMKLNKEKVWVIDCPGTYSLEPTNQAEAVALKILKEGVEGKDSIVIQVADATNLERSLNLTLQIQKLDIPLLLVLNLSDEARHIGIEIDFKRLEEILGVPVVPTCAITGEGINELKRKIILARRGNYQNFTEERWEEIGKIISQVQRVSHRHHTFWESLSDLTIRPSTGFPIAILSLFLLFLLVRFLGEGLINYLLDPLFNRVYLSLLTSLFSNLSLPLFLKEVLLGKTLEPLSSFGLLTTGLYIPFVLVLPYLSIFYLLLTLLEDLGYLPRLATLFDSPLHRFGLHGSSLIPIILGLGCKVPAIFATRILEGDREKVLATALIMMSAPCLPMTGMVISLLSPYGGEYLFLFFGLLIFLSLLTTFLLSKILPGETLELFLEIPPYRRPSLFTVRKKIWLRLSGFIKEAIPLIIAGVFFFGLLETSGLIALIGRLIGRPLLYLLGLPAETVGVIISGFLRKDVSIALLFPLNLTLKQKIISSLFLVLYLPCLSTGLIILKEFGLKKTLKVVGILLFSGILVGSLLNLILR